MVGGGTGEKHSHEPSLQLVAMLMLGSRMNGL